MTEPQAERIKKDIQKFIAGFGLKIVIKTNLKIADLLDVTFDLSKETYSPCKKNKTGNQPLYINTQSNHPPMIIKHLPGAISRRISDISSNQETFDKAKPDYEKALQDSRYTEELLYVKTPDNEDLSKSKKKKRKQNIIGHTVKLLYTSRVACVGFILSPKTVPNVSAYRLDSLFQER